MAYTPLEPGTAAQMTWYQGITKFFDQLEKPFSQFLAYYNDSLIEGLEQDDPRRTEYANTKATIEAIANLVVNDQIINAGSSDNLKNICDDILG